MEIKNKLKGTRCWVLTVGCAWKRPPMLEYHFFVGASSVTWSVEACNHCGAHPEEMFCHAVNLNEA